MNPAKSLRSRVCIIQICFSGASLAEFVGHAQALCSQRIGLLSSPLLAAGGREGHLVAARRAAESLCAMLDGIRAADSV